MMAMAVNCLVKEAKRKFARTSIFVFVHRSRTPYPRSKTVLPFCRTNAARPGASREVTTRKSESTFFSREESGDCARDGCGAVTARKTRVRMMKILFTEPPGCAEE